jgi:acetyltransferase-like isoleucine patch superfamily enzyme
MSEEYNHGSPKSGYHQRSNLFLTPLGSILHRLLRGDSARIARKSIRGEGNIFQAEGATLSGVELDIIGDRNRIIVGEGCVMTNVRFRLRGSDHLIELGKNCRVSRAGTLWLEDHHCEVRIGQNTTMVDVSISVAEPHSKALIGEECMFASDIEIRTSDAHSVIDAASGERINLAEDVTIGNHVWIASHSIILKGVNLGENSVVAAGAVITSSCPPGSILAGNPARVIKTGITWTRERIIG